MTELARRGDGSREAGAFLLGKLDGDRRSVTRVMFFDALGASTRGGGISINGLAFSKLWDLCERENLRVLGDVHSHPHYWVDQSSIDAANPMVARAGHVGVIVPNFAIGTIRPRDVGVHVYDGQSWTSFFRGAAERELFIRRWL
jgi:proteasome lid subunit RPN8/RPN11